MDLTPGDALECPGALLPAVALRRLEPPADVLEENPEAPAYFLCLSSDNRRGPLHPVVTTIFASEAPEAMNPGRCRLLDMSLINLTSALWATAFCSLTFTHNPFMVAF